MAVPGETAPRGGTAPFGFLRPAAGAALVYALAALVWVVAGGILPGGRWLAVHLFTLGVLSNLVTALTQHFAQTVTRAPGRSGALARLALLNAGALGVLVGLPTGRRLLVAAGASAAVAAVLWLYVELRRLRKHALASRFTFVVRGYERATSAFVHGALLGALLGTGVIGGAWYGGVRLAHLHLNVLGWGGLTLLSTLVFFGPTVLRTRIEEGAETVAARWLRVGATGLTVAALALLAVGLQGPAAVGARIVATAGLAAYAVTVARVCLPVLRVGRRSRPSPHGRLLQGACAWFVVAAWAVVAVTAAGGGRWYDALGLLLLTGVLGQAILAATAYLAPMVWAAGSDARTRMRGRLERLPWVRPVTFNAGVTLLVAGAAGPAGADAAALALRAGWVLVGAAALAQVVLATSSVRLRRPAGAA